MSASLAVIAMTSIACCGCQKEAPQTTSLVRSPTPESLVSPAQFSTAIEVAVPVGGSLQMRPISRAIIDDQSRTEGDRLPVLNEVIRLAPAYFPSGARVLPSNAKVNQGTEAINLNRAFADAKFWKNRSRQDTKLAFHALARVLAFRNQPKGASEAVLFLVEGKRVMKIGSFSTKAPLQPEDIIGVATEVQRHTQQSQRKN